METTSAGKRSRWRLILTITPLADVRLNLDGERQNHATAFLQAPKPGNIRMRHTGIDEDGIAWTGINRCAVAAMDRHIRVLAKVFGRARRQIRLDLGGENCAAVDQSVQP